MSHSYVVTRRKARKWYTCPDATYAHDRTINPGDYYCHVKVVAGEGADRGWGKPIQFCDGCGSDEFPEYQDLAEKAEDHDHEPA